MEELTMTYEQAVAFLKKYMEENGIGYAKIGYPTPTERTIVIKKDEYTHTFDIDALREKG